MRLPFQKLRSETVDHEAADLAAILSWDEAKAGWGLVKLERWALARCADDSPPSAQSLVRGSGALKVVATAAGWRKEPELFLAACEQLPSPPACRVTDDAGELCVDLVGVLQPYDEAWAKAKKERDRKAAARAKEEAETDRDMSEDGPRSSGGGSTDGEGKKEMKKEMKNEKPPLEKEEEQLELEPSGNPGELPSPGEHPLQALWNRLAHPELPRWVGLSKTRKRIADARLKERSLQEYARIIERINASKFCRGVNDRNWKVTPDWFLKPDNIDKVLGGNFDGGEPPTPTAAEEPLPTLPATPAGSLWGRVLAKLRDDGHDYPLQWLRKLAPVAIQGGALVLEVEDVFLAEWVGATYGELLNAAVVELGGASRVTCRPPQAPEVTA